jgi:hypothetical protein|nr:hypothetical protein [Candidatus Krumholzibacteria bacterium]
MDASQIEGMLAEFRHSVDVMQATGIGQLYGLPHFPPFLGRNLAMMCGDTSQEDQQLTAFLSEIPTETTLGERKLLFNLFRKFWDGQEHVLEVGPYLGGTSRAIASGMLHSKNRQSQARLFTYDKFRDYYQPRQLLETLMPLFAAGKLGEAEKECITQRNSFKEVYDKLHGAHDYGQLITSSAGVLPDDPDAAPLPDALLLPEDRNYSAVFVDGAKSWYGTKVFMTQALAHTRPGSLYIFQDYGAHTCFWIPVFLELMKDKFQLLAYVDHTYCYQQIAEVSAEEIGDAFPDRATDFSAADYGHIFRNLYDQALEMDNTYTLLNFQLQHAAALAYIGHIDEARNRIIDLLKTPFALRYRGWINRALATPTYTPQGNVNLF